MSASRNRFTPPYPYAHPITGEVFPTETFAPIPEATKPERTPGATSAFGRNLEELARVLDGEVIGGQILCPAPGHSRRDRGLSVKLDPSAPEGFVVNLFNGCDDDDWRRARDYVKQAWGLPIRHNRYKASASDDFGEQTEQPNQQPSEKELARIKYAERIWDEAIDPRGTLGERYLKFRALVLPAELIGSALRFHPTCPWGGERVPAVVAPFRSILTEQITGILRIALNPDGTKLDRRMLGRVSGAAVKLDPPADTLVIGEGVETCMAARQLGLQPCWAVGSAGAIGTFPLFPGVATLTILGERGKGEAASRQAIRECTRRWRRAGRQVDVAWPDVRGDANDELILLELLK
jgi:putative DNA primase/helicase